MRWLLCLYWVLCISLIAACDRASSNLKSGEAEVSYTAPQAETKAVPSPPPPPPGEVAPEEAKGEANVEIKLIKTGTLVFETSDLNATAQRVSRATTAHDGFLSNEVTENGYGRVTQSMTIRVPSRNFDQLIEAISKGVERFDSKTIQATDVTEEFVDAEARLKTKKQLELRYQELLKRANKVSEILEIEQQIGELRAEIESVEGRLRYLSNRVDYSTLDVQFYQRMPNLERTDRHFGRAFLQGWDNFVSLLFSLVANWSTILILAIAGFFLQRFVRRKLKK